MTKQFSSDADAKQIEDDFEEEDEGDESTLLVEENEEKKVERRKLEVLSDLSFRMPLK